MRLIFLKIIFEITWNQVVDQYKNWAKKL